MGRGAGTQIGQRKVFLNGHVGPRPLERVLKQVADDLAALVLRRKGDILSAQMCIRDSYKGEYIGHYCKPCECFWTDSQKNGEPYR